MLWAQIPSVRVSIRLPISAKIDLSTGLAVEEFQHASAAVTGETRDVMQSSGRKALLSGRSGRTLTISADPHSLQVSKKKVGSHDQRCFTHCGSRLGQPRKQSVDR